MEASVASPEMTTADSKTIDGYRMAGKSGTAQKFDAATGQYSKSRYVSSFACGAPADAPRAVVLVSINEPTAGPSYYGGTVAAPTAAAILKQTLAVIDAGDELTSSPTVTPY